MKILLVGNIDIAGRYIATRMYKEGHHVSWLTGEKKKSIFDERIRGRTYRNVINLSNARRVMRAEDIDTLIFLTAGLREAGDPGTHESLLGWERMVLLAARHAKVKRIVFLSSSALRSEELLGTDLEELRSGERICQAFCSENRIGCVIVRIGYLYGIDVYEELGFLGGILRTMADKKPTMSVLDADSTIDIMDGRDLADALERLISLEKDGVYTVTTGYPMRVEHLCNICAATLAYPLETAYGAAHRKEYPGGDVRIKEETGWLPFHVFEEEGADVIGEIVRHNEELRVREQGKKKVRKLGPAGTFAKETLQNLLMFAAALLLVRFSTDWSDIRFVDVRLLYVVLISLLFGMRQGIIAMVLASVSYLTSLLFSGVDITYILYSIESWIPFILYGIVGAFAGYITDKRNDEQRSMREEYRDLEEKYDFLKRIYRSMVEVKNRLQKQIMISKDSFQRVYEITEQLDCLSPQMIMFKTIHVLEDIMECSRVAIYTKTKGGDDYGRMAACSAALAGRIPVSVDFATYPKLRQALHAGSMYVNRELDEDYPSYAMPVLENGRSVAIVFLYDLELDKYTVYYRNLFTIVVQMVQHNLIHAYRYQETERSRRFIEGTGILQPGAFVEEEQMLAENAEELAYHYCIGRLTDFAQMELPDLSMRLSSLLRGTDIVGLGPDGTLVIILMFVERKHRDIIEQRLMRGGFRINWEG